MGTTTLLLSTAAGATDSQALIRDFVAAFNEHDVAAMLELATDDVRWYGVSAADISVEAEGRVGLGKAMQGYFDSVPSAQSELLGVQGEGEYLQVIERASWQADGETLSQCSAATYRINDGKIAAVWYFPAYDCI